MAGKLHCAYCFDTIISTFHPQSYYTAHPDEIGNDKYPMFVTWRKHNGDEKSYRLRGCIGTFSARDLRSGLKDYAIHSAFRDSRFQPLKNSEVSYLSCDVSLLTNFEKVHDIMDWQIGVHGITIDFTNSTRESYSATYLPDVAHEQGWSRQQTINELIRKAGYKGSPSSAVMRSLTVTRYQSSKCSMSYHEYAHVHTLKHGVRPPTG